MIGFCWFGSFSKNYAWEMQIFARTRKFSDGITFFKINFNLDKFKSEHNPNFMFEFTLLNIYNHFMIYKR